MDRLPPAFRKEERIDWVSPKGRVLNDLTVQHLERLLARWRKRYVWVSTVTSTDKPRARVVSTTYVGFKTRPGILPALGPFSTTILTTWEGTDPHPELHRSETWEDAVQVHERIVQEIMGEVTRPDSGGLQAGPASDTGPGVRRQTVLRGDGSNFEFPGHPAQDPQSGASPGSD